MQCLKLVNGGFVDRVIVFDSLPEFLIKGIRTREAAGFPRNWAKWLSSIGSVRPVYKTETNVDLARNWIYKHTPIGEEPCFYLLDYQDINSDKEAWKKICDYLKQHCGESVRLKEKIEDMARPLAPSCTVALDIDPEDVPVIPLPDVAPQEEEKPEIIQAGEQIVIEEEAPKRRGRPKKVVVEA